MKLKLLCFSFVTLFGLLNGSVLQIGANPYLTYGLPYGDLGIPYGSSGDLISSLPWTYYGLNNGCSHHITNETITDFRVSIFKFITLLYKKAGELSKGHFVFSPQTVWLSMAALAEGTEGSTRQELFSVLSLPEDRCIRQIFYQLATTRENPTNDVVLARNRLFITDSNVHVNRNWENFARSQTYLNTVSMPIKSNPSGVTEHLKGVFNAKLPNLDLTGNAFLMESLDYRGLWQSAFSDATITTGPFYDAFGEQIGSMEYMKITQQVKIGIAASANMKVIELPVGRDGQYRMLFGIFLGNQDFARSLDGFKNDLIFETLANMRLTPGPIEIVVPRLTMTSEVDMKKVLEDVGVQSLWMDPSATRNISEPAALPSSFVQRVTVTIDNSCVRPLIQEYSNFVPALDQGSANLGDDLKDFVANKPFLFGLFDSEYYTCLFAATFSRP